MHFDINKAFEQADQIKTHAHKLRDTRAALLSFQQLLQQLWRGEEVEHLNIVINNFSNKLAFTATELDTIAIDINPAAQEVRRQEDLEAAQIILNREDANVANLRLIFENAQRQHNMMPNPASLALLTAAQTNLNNAIQVRNDAAARVRALMR